MQSQNEAVVQYMKENGGISSMDAFNNLGVTRLSARIYDLKQHGYVIDSEYYMGRNRYGNPTRYARYRIVKYPEVNDEQ